MRYGTLYFTYVYLAPANKPLTRWDVPLKSLATQNYRFLPRDALLSAVYAVVVCLSVCLSVCVCVCVCVCHTPVLYQNG